MTKKEFEKRFNSFDCGLFSDHARRLITHSSPRELFILFGDCENEQDVNKVVSIIWPEEEDDE